MKYLIALASLTLPLSVSATHPPVWLNPVPASLGGTREPIPDTLFFEVPISKFDAAFATLQAKAFARQNYQDADYFGHAGFMCPGSSKPYLVRALYKNGATGSFVLTWVGDALIVEHASLGSKGTIFKSALFACLSKDPTQVYSSISGAL